MKKRRLLIMMLISMTVMTGFTGCSNDKVSDSTSVTEAKSKGMADSKSEDNFEWDGNIIVRLSEQGAAQTSIVIPKRCEGFEGMSFEGRENSISEVSFESDKNITLNAIFTNAKKIKKITLPANLETIGEMEFWLCSSLEEINIPATVVSIGKYAFQENTSLTQVDFEGNALTEIGPYVFDGCKKLAEVVLPDSVSNIAEYAFYECSALETVKLPKSLKNVGGFAFANSGLKNLLIDTEMELDSYEGTSFVQVDHSVDVTISKDSWADKHFDDVFNGGFEKKYN